MSIFNLKPNPRSHNAARALHDKAQQCFNDYVVNQVLMRKQCQNVEILLALNNNDADLILGMIFFFVNKFPS
jgi:hypothetical protein